MNLIYRRQFRSGELVRIYVAGNSTRFRRREFETTKNEDRLIAKAARVGDKDRPRVGRNSPAATGR